MQKRIFLIGFMGSGKTTLGSRLARSLHYDFVDMDQLIVETAGMSIPEIFSQHGESMFRKWEGKILDELSSRNRIVISTGGGAPCHGDMMERMKSAGTTIYIQMSPGALKNRLKNSRTQRPLLEGKSEKELEEYITHLLEKREPYYSQAQYTLDGLNLTVDSLTRILQG